MRKIHFVTALVFMAAAAIPQLALAGKTHSFYGDIIHVSVTNLKVIDPKSKQTLGFYVVPKFDRVFSENGKTTYQMKDLKAGQYVRVVYDQNTLGARHADKIFILNNANMLKAKQIPSHIH